MNKNHKKEKSFLSACKIGQSIFAFSIIVIVLLGIFLSTFACAVFASETSSSDSAISSSSSIDSSSTPISYYTLSYNANGGSGAPADPNLYASGSVVTVQGGNLTRDGYSFSGWSTSPSGGVEYHPGGLISLYSNVTLYAVWSADAPAASSEKTYNLYYDPNGGVGGPATERGFTYDQQVTVSFGKPTRSGYTFLYWTTNSNGTGTKYGGGNTFTIHTETTLYAQWKSNGAATTSKKTSATTSSAPSTSSESPSSIITTSDSTISTSEVASSLSSETSVATVSSATISSSSNTSSTSNITTNILPPSELLEALIVANVPIIGSVPLHNAGLNGTWSIFNLIAILVSVVFSIIILAKFLLSGSKPDVSPSHIKVTILGILLILIGPFSTLLLLLLEQFNGLMVFFNSYSILFVFLLVIQIILFVLFLARDKKTPKNNDEKLAESSSFSDTNAVSSLDSSENSDETFYEDEDSFFGEQ